MADTQQGIRHQSARDAAGTVDTYDGDLRALFNAVATVPAGSTFNEAFMLWLQSVTGSSADNINDLAALFASQQDDTYNWSSVGELGLPKTFLWNPETAQELPSTATFTRASTAPISTSTDGSTSWTQTALAGEPRFAELRRVEDFMTVVDYTSAGLEGGATFIAKRFVVGLQGENAYEFSFTASASDAINPNNTFPSANIPKRISAFIRKISGTGSTLRFRAGGGTGLSADFTVTSSFQRFSPICFQTTGSGIRVINGSSGDDIVFQVYFIQAETTQTNTEDNEVSQFVNPLLVFNAEVASVRIFNKTNANTVASGVVSEADGTLFTGGGYLAEPVNLPQEADVLNSGVAIASAFGALFDFTAPSSVTGTVSLLGASSSAVDILRLDATFNVIMDDGGTPVTIGTVSADQRFKVSYGRDGTGRSASLDGATVVTGGAPGSAHEGENFHLFCTAGASQPGGLGHSVTLYQIRPSDSQLEQISS